MAGEEQLERLREKFSFLEGKVLGVLLFGSSAKGEATQRSDRDICIVAPDKDPGKVLREIFRNIDTEKENLDVHIFKELPLRLKIDIIRNYKVIYTPIEPELTEYFYRYRRRWEDQEKRNTMAKEEIIKTIKG